jgi:putative endopeptidase
MKFFRFASVLLFCSGLAFAQNTLAPADNPSSKAPVEPKPIHSFDVSAIDKTADPCVDFYSYACGNWRKNNPIPGDQSRWGRFNELGERDRYLLWVDLDRAANDPRTPLQRQYGNFYAACMNSDLADQLGDKPLLPVLALIDKLNDKQELAALVARLQVDNATQAFFRFGVEQDQKNSLREIAAVYQGGLSLPDRDYYLLDDDRMTKIRQQY